MAQRWLNATGDCMLIWLALVEAALVIEASSPNRLAIANRHTRSMRSCTFNRASQQ